MFRRSFPIFLITLVFLLSTWSNVIGASYCPHFSVRPVSIKQTGKPATPVKSEACHHEMAQMDMDDEAETSTADKLNPAQAVWELPDMPCGHCWMHSQPASGNSTVVAPGPSSESLAADAPVEAAFALPLTFINPITPVEHGPPGNSLPRHVLINVFRI